jgi:hypothetical protein
LEIEYLEMHSLYFLCFIGLILSTFVSCEEWFNQVKALRDSLVKLTSSRGKIDFSTQYGTAFLLEAQLTAKKNEIAAEIKARQNDPTLAKPDDELFVMFPKLGVRAFTSCLNALRFLKEYNLAEAKRELKKSVELDNTEWKQHEEDLINKVSEIQKAKEPIFITRHIKTANTVLSYYTRGPTITAPDKHGGNLKTVQVSLQNAINFLPTIDDPEKPVEWINTYLEEIRNVLQQDHAREYSKLIRFDMNANRGSGKVKSAPGYEDLMGGFNVYANSGPGKGKIAPGYENFRGGFDMYAHPGPVKRKSSPGYDNTMGGFNMPTNPGPGKRTSQPGFENLTGGFDMPYANHVPSGPPQWSDQWQPYNSDVNAPSSSQGGYLEPHYTNINAPGIYPQENHWQPYHPDGNAQGRSSQGGTWQPQYNDINAPTNYPQAHDWPFIDANMDLS